MGHSSYAFVTPAETTSTFPNHSDLSMRVLITSRAVGALVMPRLLRKRIVLTSHSAGKSFGDLHGVKNLVIFAFGLWGVFEFRIRDRLKMFDEFL